MVTFIGLVAIAWAMGPRRELVGGLDLVRIIRHECRLFRCVRYRIAHVTCEKARKFRLVDSYTY